MLNACLSCSSGIKSEHISSRFTDEREKNQIRSRVGLKRDEVHAVEQRYLPCCRRRCNPVRFHVVSLGGPRGTYTFQLTYGAIYSMSTKYIALIYNSFINVHPCN